MSRVRGSLDIARPVEVVFDVVADQRNEPSYNPAMTAAAKVTDGPIGVGARFEATVVSRGTPRPVTIEYTSFERPHRIDSHSVHTRYFLRRYMPTNLLLDAIRTRRRGLKWGIPVMLLAIPYILIANVCVQLIEAGAPGWLHLVVLWAIWNMLKMLWIGPVSAVLLIRVRVRESVTARRERASSPAEADDAEERAVVDAIGIR